MQAVEDFMLAYFAARSTTIQQEEQVRGPFRQMFFSPGCIWDSREGALHASQSEKIESIDLSGEEARVATQQDHFFSRLRYVLRRSGES